MAKKAAKASSQLFEAVFRFQQTTKNTNRFSEEPEEGRGEKGWLQTIYIKKPYLEKAAVITVHVSPAEEGAVSNFDAKPMIQVVFAKSEDKKNSVKYEEVVAKEGERGLCGSLYVNNAAFGDEEAPDLLMVEIEG